MKLNQARFVDLSNCRDTQGLGRQNPPDADGSPGSLIDDRSGFVLGGALPIYSATNIESTEETRSEYLERLRRLDACLCADCTDGGEEPVCFDEDPCGACEGCKRSGEADDDALAEMNFEYGRATGRCA